MPLTDPDLWKVIETWPLPHRPDRDFEFSPPRRCSSFQHNLRKIGDWTDESSVAITAAYRRFLYLKAVTGQTITPPACIDRAWHLHLGFPKDYANLEAAIGARILHQEKLTEVERTEAFERGRQLWIAEFGEDPPARIWPTLQGMTRNRVGNHVATAGLVLWGLGCFVDLGENTWIGVALLGAGFIVFLAGAGYGGEVDPEVVSRCG